MSLLSPPERHQAVVYVSTIGGDIVGSLLVQKPINGVGDEGEHQQLSDIVIAAWR